MLILSEIFTRAWLEGEIWEGGERRRRIKTGANDIAEIITNACNVSLVEFDYCYILILRNYLPRTAVLNLSFVTATLFAAR